MAKKPAIVNDTSNDSPNDTVFPDKWAKKLPTGWQDTASAMKEDELKRVIVECESNIYVIDKEKTNDATLKGAREIVKEKGAPYRDAKSTQEAKIKYALFLLENRGTELDSRDNES